MSISQALIDALTVNIQALFKTSYGEFEKAAKYKSLVLESKSDGSQEEYKWVSSVPSMVEWKDERQLRTLLAEAYVIANKNYESTIEVDRNDVEDDRLGVLKPRILQLAERAAAFPNRLVFSLLDAGETAKTFDGVAFYSTTRKIGESANINNVISGAGITEANIRTDIAKAVTAMGQFTDDRNEPLDLTPDTIVCSKALELPIRQALLPAESGEKRIEAEYIKQVIGTGWITDTTDWHILCTTSVLKPVILQIRKAPELVYMDRPDSHEAFMRRRFLYGVDARYGAGLLDPRTAILVVNGG